MMESIDTAPPANTQGGQESDGVTGQPINNPGNPAAPPSDHTTHSVGSMDTAPPTTAQGGQESLGVTGQSIDNPGNPSSASAQGGQVSSGGTDSQFPHKQPSTLKQLITLELSTQPLFSSSREAKTNSFGTASII